VANAGDRGRIVVGTDGSDGSLAAVRIAATEARLRGVPLEVVCAWHPGAVGSIPAFGVGTPVAETLDELNEALASTLAAEGLGPDSDLEVIATVVAGHAAEALLDASDNAALVVVGTRGRGGFAGLVLGSVSQQVAAHARCPVMVVPSS
jgi:nucleotide-binding universal stress UspA family protein